MEGTEPWGACEDKRRDPGDIFGVTFQVIFQKFGTSHFPLMDLLQDITIAARSTLNETNVLWGMEGGLIYDFTFDNVVIAGEKIESLEQFYHNEYVLPLIVP